MRTKHSSSAHEERAEEVSANRRVFTEPSLCKPDGMHFTVEGKTLSRTATLWECIERSWELPEPLTMHWEAETVARALALRADGELAYRVVDPSGKVLQVFVVKKYLFGLEAGLATERLEEVPPGYDVPMVSEVLSDRQQRARVFFTAIDPCAVFQRCRDLITRLRTRIGAVKRQLYQPFYTHITSDATLIDDQPHYFLTSAEALKDRQQFLQELYGRGYDPEESAGLTEEEYREKCYADGDYGTIVAEVIRPFPTVQAQGPTGMVTLRLQAFDPTLELPTPAPLHAVPKKQDGKDGPWVYADEDGERFIGVEVQPVVTERSDVSVIKGESGA